MEIDCVVFDQPSSVLSLTVQVVNQKLKSDFKASYIFDDNLALTGSTIVKKPAMDDNLMVGGSHRSNLKGKRGSRGAKARAARAVGEEENCRIKKPFGMVKSIKASTEQNKIQLEDAKSKFQAVGAKCIGRWSFSV